MTFHRAFLYPIIIAIFIGVLLWIFSVPYFGSLERTVLSLISLLIFFSSFLLIVGLEK